MRREPLGKIAEVVKYVLGIRLLRTTERKYADLAVELFARVEGVSVRRLQFEVLDGDLD